MTTHHLGLLLLPLALGVLLLGMSGSQKIDRLSEEENAQPAPSEAACSPGPVWTPAEEQSGLPPSLPVRWRYHFNRNALSSLCVTPEGIVTLTDSGNLLRFDPNTLRLTCERPIPVGATGLFADREGPLAVSADGTVSRVNARTLALTEGARLPGPAGWIGRIREKGASVLRAVIPRPREADRQPEFTLCRIGPDGVTDTTCVVPQRFPWRWPSAYYLDAKQRLWLGTDAGEWGGGCTYLDLGTDRVEEIEGHTSGVYGFVGLPDGQVWAYGGTTHLGLNDGFIARVDRGRIECLADFSGNRVRREPPDRPRFPITHILPDPCGGGLLVFAYRDLFRVDPGLTKWQYLGPVALRYVWGRPDAMGSYPALRSIQPAPDGSGDLLGATARDGLVRIAGGKVTSFPIRGQLGEDFFPELLPLPGRTLIFGKSLWRQVEGRWEQMPLEPPLEPDAGTVWYEHRPFATPEGDLVILSRDNSSPNGVAALTRWRDGQSTVLSSQRGRNGVGFAARSVFMVQGQLWTAGYQNLLRLEGEGWVRAGRSPDGLIWDLTEVGSAGPRWLLCGNDRLFRLHPGTGAGDAVLEPVSLPAEVGKVHNAVAFDAGRVLLATDGGLRLLATATGELSQPSFAPKGAVKALGRDLRGRLWLAGDSVWLQRDGKVLSPPVPSLPQGTPLAIAPDAEHQDGVLISLAGRGVLAVRAE
jgi:hypothetical protein